MARVWSDLAAYRQMRLRVMVWRTLLRTGARAGLSHPRRDRGQRWAGYPYGEAGTCASRTVRSARSDTRSDENSAPWSRISKSKLPLENCFDQMGFRQFSQPAVLLRFVVDIGKQVPGAWSGTSGVRRHR